MWETRGPDLGEGARLCEGSWEPHWGRQVPERCAAGTKNRRQTCSPCMVKMWDCRMRTVALRKVVWGHKCACEVKIIRIIFRIISMGAIFRIDIRIVRGCVVVWESTRVLSVYENLPHGLLALLGLCVETWPTMTEAMKTRKAPRESQ